MSDTHKIIFCRWNSICERGITRAFEKLGYDMVCLDKRFTSVDYDKDYLLELSKLIILHRDADLVFSINFIPIIARVCNNLNIKYYSWIVDSPCFQLYSDTLTMDTNRVFIFDYSLYEKFVNVNPNCIFHFPLGADVDFYDGVSLNNADYKSYGCDVSFVGSLYSEKCPYNGVQKDLPEYMRGYCEGLIRAQMNVYGYNFLEDVVSASFAEKFKEYAKWNSLGPDYTEDVIGIVADTYLGQKCTELERIETFNSIADKYSMDLWTLSDTTPLKKVNVRGGADTETMMPKIIKCSKINLNLTSKPIKTGLPLRIFDIMGCGGFLISNYQAEIPGIFVPDEDIVVYEDINDLIYKIGYYLEHDDQRRIIADNGYRKVRERYSYEARLSEMMTSYR